MVTDQGPHTTRIPTAIVTGRTTIMAQNGQDINLIAIDQKHHLKEDHHEYSVEVAACNEDKVYQTWNVSRIIEKAMTVPTQSSKTKDGI
jgi:hypothetical protein